MNIQELEDVIQALIPIAKQAGNVIMTHRENGVEPIVKEDGTPVTLADQEAEALIIDKIDQMGSEYPIIGEELVAAGNAPSFSSPNYWLIDALDGTRGFIKGGKDFTVNIALVNSAKPILGVVYAPALDLLFVGGKEIGAFKGSAQEPFQSYAPVRCRPVPEEGITVTLNSHTARKDRIESLFKGVVMHEVLKQASSLKLCSIAEGRADLYPRFGETSEWDTAAGQAILNAAGGRIINMDEQGQFIYGDKAGHFNNPHFVALSDALYQRWAL